MQCVTTPTPPKPTPWYPRSLPTNMTLPSLPLARLKANAIFNAVSTAVEPHMVKKTSEKRFSGSSCRIFSAKAYGSGCAVLKLGAKSNLTVGDGNADEAHRDGRMGEEGGQGWDVRERWTEQHSSKNYCV